MQAGPLPIIGGRSRFLPRFIEFEIVYNENLGRVQNPMRAGPVEAHSVDPIVTINEEDGIAPRLSQTDIGTDSDATECIRAQTDRTEGDTRRKSPFFRKGQNPCGSAVIR